LAVLFKHAEIFPHVNNLTAGRIRKLGQAEKDGSSRTNSENKFHDGFTDKVLKR
jgi:hypothetical protein